MCDSKKLRFIKGEEASGLLSNLELKHFGNKVLVLNDALFYGFRISEKCFY